MTFFVTIVALYLAQILCYSAQTILVLIIVFFEVNRLGAIDSDGQAQAFLTLLTLLLLSVAVFLLSPSLSGKL